jgi:hypothetical protein
MAAEYYHVESENGDRADDPSEDALFMRLADLNHTDNTYLTVESVDDTEDWYATVSLLDEGEYEVELRDPRRAVHEITVEAEGGRVARDLTIWLAASTGSRSLRQ